MVQESDSKESPPPEKLLIDDPSDFQFHVAYFAYSNAYDKIVDPEARRKLNLNIKTLQEKQIDYPTFYRNISQYRTEDSSQHAYGRTLIKTQKKREWRRKTQKHERIERHKR